MRNVIFAACLLLVVFSPVVFYSYFECNTSIGNNVCQTTRIAKYHKGRLKTDYQGRISLVDFYNAALTDSDLATIAVEVPHLRQLHLSFCRQVSSRGLLVISNLDCLEVLQLNSTNVTDELLLKSQFNHTIKELGISHTSISEAGINTLSTCTRLQSLDLSGNRFDESCLKLIGRSTSIRTLNLSDTSVTDLGMLHISNMTSLEELLLQSVSVSDVGFMRLASLGNLKNIYINGTNVSSNAIAELAKRLPNAHFHR
jgi:hypothetical protein